jgi:cytochrome bd-type quinol oxidase subunit 2
MTTEFVTNYLPFLLFFILLVVAACARRRESASGRQGIRHITIYGVAFCVLSLSLWFLTRFEDVLDSFPGSHHASVFGTPWLWVSALCIGIALLLISFLTRKSRRNAA